jgi:monoamine oxidase
VIVLGAGVSGLQTAWLLEQQGMKVTVLESRAEVGGRVRTLLDQPGYPEMGFNSMGEAYGRGLDAATRSGVEMQEVGSRWRHGAPPLLWINGKPMTRAEWAQFPGNPLPDKFKMLLPAEVVGKAVSDGNRLADWTTWHDPAHAALDVSLHQLLRAFLGARLAVYNKAAFVRLASTPFGIQTDDNALRVHKAHIGLIPIDDRTGKSRAIARRADDTPTL